MKSRRYGAAFAILAALLLILLAMNLCIGSVNIPLSEILHILMKNSGSDTYTDIVMNIRFPRALAAAVLGGGLALAGYLLQTFFHNPIAGPFTLGISSGAKLVVALVMVASLGNALRLSSWVMIAAAFVGAMICMGFVILMSSVIEQMAMLIVSGVMIGYICSAVTDFIVTFAEDADIVNLHNWSKGSFSGMTWENVKVMVLVTGIASIGVFLLSKPISAYEMGEAYAANMGLNVKKAILCCKTYHARRSLMYYQILYPEAEIIVCPSCPDGITRENWRETEAGVEAVTGELNRIIRQFCLMLGDRG